MTAQELARLLAAQAAAAPHHIRLDDATLRTTGLDDLVRNDLRRKDGTLVLVVDPAKIPPDPDPGGFTIGVNVPAGSDGFLGLDGRDATLRFVVGATIDLELTVATQKAGGATVPWVFSTSFPELALLPYDDLDLDTPTLVLSTGAPGTHPKGLDFDGVLELTGIFGTVATLLDLAKGYRLTGPIDGSGAELSLDLEAHFGLDPPPTIGGMVTLQDVGAGVALTPAKKDGATDRLVQIYLLAQVDFTNLSGPTPKVVALDLKASMPVANPDSPVLILSVYSPPGFQTSLGALGALIGGESWDDFFKGPAKSIGDLLDKFGLKSYTVTVAVTTGTVISMALDVGTLSSWSMWDGGPTLDIDVLWTVIWLAGKGQNRVTLTADFTYPPPPAENPLEFELTIDSDLHITGTEKGKLPELKLSDLNENVFGGHVVIPDDLLDVEVQNFSFTADVKSKHFTIGATASASVGLFGTQVLGVRNMMVNVSFDAGSNEPSTYTGTLDGQVFLGPITLQADATISNAKGVDTVFTLHLVDETIGSMLNHLVHIVDPTYDVSFGDPWDKFLDISLDAFVLEVNVTKGSVALAYEPKSPIDLEFLTIEKVSLTYTKGSEGKASSTKIDVAGTFLGIHFPSGDNKLSWDPINESPPAVPGKGGSVFDLQYAGLGQHIGLGGDPETMDEVMEKLRATASPIQPGALPPFGKDLVFKGDSSWLIGAQFTVIDTVAISAIFNDPDLYGVVLQLSGEKAKIFAGLRFEILYRKVTDTIGVYHIELKLPDAMRHLEFGEVSVTLPIVDLDIYTNGNFRVDFGFPKGLNFSNSFSIQVFPFVGFGGFYFALLDGSTSTRVPQITNGTFSPVIEFGVALSIGVGKEIDEGILKGGISVTVVGILEGVLAWFHPTDAAPAETYFWFKGTIAVTGKLYATIDFAIIQASVDVTAYISVTLVIECHEPIHIDATASVSVRVSVKIIFFTIHLSFQATVDASFTIGSQTPTPWIVKSGSSSSDGKLGLLTGQRTLHGPLALVHPGRAKALRRARIAALAPPPITTWPAVCVLPQGKQTATIKALPAFTKAESWTISTAVRSSGVVTVTTASPHDLDVGDAVALSGVGDSSFDGAFAVASVPGSTSFTVAQAGSDTSTTGGVATAASAAASGDVVLLLTAESSVPPNAHTLAEHRVLAGDDPGSLPFNLLMQAMLGWGIYVETHRAIASVGRASGVTTVETTAPHGFPTGTQVTVSGVADNSFDGTFAIASVSTPTSFTYAQAGGADATSSGGVASIGVVTADQLEDLRWQLTQTDTVDAAFDYGTLTAFLAANFTFDVERADTSKDSAGALFPMFPAIKLTDSAGTSVDFSAKTLVDQDYVEKIRAYFRLLQVQFQAASGNGTASAAGGVGDGAISMATVLFTQYFQMLLSSGAKAAIDFLASYPYKTGSQPMSIGDVAGAIGDSTLLEEPLRIVIPNQDAAVLEPGAQIDLPDVVHQVRAGETFAGIATALAAQGALGPDLKPFSAADLLNANLEAAVFATGVPLPLAGLPYTTVAGDSVNLIATRVLVRALGTLVVNALLGLQPEVQALVASSGITDPNAPLDPTKPVKLPDGTKYQPVLGDTLTLLAAYLLAPAQRQIDLPTYAAALQAANPWLPADPTAPVPADKTVSLATLARPLMIGDTVDSLAETLMTTADAVATTLLAMTTPVLAPQAVLKAPLTYSVGAGDTFSGIAGKLDLTLEYLAGRAALATGLFAPSQPLTISDLGAIDPQTLVTGLLGNAEWNNAAGMVSRFLLSGIRLPDPSDPNFQKLTPEQLLDPKNLAGIRTKPAFELTGQQYPLAPTVPQNYQVTLANAAGVQWLTLGGSGSEQIQFDLTTDEQQLFADLASTPLQANVETLTRLALYRMAPPRIALQTHIAWQAALPPAGCFPAGGAAGNPSVWMFPDSLVVELEQTAVSNPGALLPYELVTAKHVQAGTPVTATEAGCYSWATLVNVTVSLPTTDGPAASVSNAYVVEGADDVGASLLQQVQARVAGGDSASLYLLYSPDPTSGNTSGLASDVLDSNATYILKTNLSTLTNAQQDAVFAEVELADPTDVYAASLADAADFLSLVWEASITRSGGFYLNYVNKNGGAGLPATVFGTGSTAQLSLVVLLRSQSGLWPILPATATPPGAVRAGGTTTISTSCVHGLSVGDTVTVAGVGDSSFDGTFTVASVPTSGAFTYAQAGATDAKSGGGACNEGNTRAVSSGLLPFNNCAVVGDNVDPTVTSLFVQPATHTVQPTDTLQAVADSFDARWGLGLQAADVATLNASVPQLLAVGAALTVPSQPSYEIGYGDTFDSIVAKLAQQGVQTSVSALGTANAGTSILAPGAAAQFANGVLRPATTVPPGVAGFELTRTNPDPGKTFNQLTPAEKVGALFNLVGWSLAGEGAFIASGAGLPTTPSDQLLLQSDGLTRLDPDETGDTNWYYQQTLAVAPFGSSATGTTSPALPLPASDPYNGVGLTAGALNEATIGLALLDVYGNAQPLASPDSSLDVPVGYYDDLAGPLSWPSLAISYLVTGPPVELALDMTMQQARYIPSSSVAVPSALAAIAADLKTYTGVYYQLVQPDVSFALETTLALGTDGKTPVSYPLPKTPFLSFVSGAYVYLQALSTMKAVQVTPGAGGTTVQAIVDDYGVTAEQLFAANQNQLYSALFGAAAIAVPQMYSTIESDTLETIVARWPDYHLTPTALAEANQHVPLDPGVDLAAGTRTVKAVPAQGAPAASLDDVAAAAHASPVAIAVANAPTTGILYPTAVLALGTQTYAVGQNDSIAIVAGKLGGTVEQVALANPAVPLIVPETPLTVNDVLVATGDTFASLAQIAGVGTVDSLATANEALPNLFAPQTRLLIGPSSSPKPPLPSDTLASFAAENGVTVEDLAGQNSGATFVQGATVDVPGTLQSVPPAQSAQFCTYSAPSNATIDTIAALFGTTPQAIAALNPVQPGPGGLWICPPMRGDAYGQNAGGSLSGLAQAYNADAGALATANAAALGVLATGVSVTVGGTSYKTQANDTLNSLVNRFAALGVTVTLAEVVAAATTVPNLMAPQAQIVPVPPPSPSNSVQIAPSFGSATFQIAVNVIETRNAALVDPDFAGAPTVQSATVALVPEPDPSSTATTLSLTDFAAKLETAIPGLHVATGDPAAEDDPVSATAIWGVNLGSTAGPAITYKFNPGDVAYFALPPLSTALFSGDNVPIIPYVTGQDPPFTGPSQPQSFRGVDLDLWLSGFLTAVDLFLTPAYAVPAYALSPTSTLAVVTAKQQLAKLISAGVKPVLEGETGFPSLAAEALCQSMLNQLSTAYTVSTLVQVPVGVTSQSSDVNVAPRLSGKVGELANGPPTQLPQAYSFSTAKVPLTNGGSAATFLFSVKAPASDRQVNLNLEYAVTELEMPDPAETKDDYQGSYWLKFVRPIATTDSSMTGLEIPVPLRAYPGPVTLAQQSGIQSVDPPKAATDLLPWDFSFVYQHDDAEQDTPVVEVAFNTVPSDGASLVGDGPDAAVVTAVFEQLAQFTSAYPGLKNDLAVLAALGPGATSPNQKAAVDAFSWLVTKVADAFKPKPTEEPDAAFQPVGLTLSYQLQKEQANGVLTDLVITWLPPKGTNPPASPLWPSQVFATYPSGTPEQQLTLVGTTSTQATFAYPKSAAIPADAQLAQRFVFPWPGATGCTGGPAPTPPPALTAPQTFQFQCVNVLSEQSARAGVSILRNLELVYLKTTNPAFVYRTPVTSFTSSAIPTVTAPQQDAIAIGSGSSPTGVAEALGKFLEQLLTSQNSWAPTDTLNMRFAGGYSYPVATTAGETLSPVVPIFLVASVDFNPTSDWDWTNPNSFVSQAQAVVTDWWQTSHLPPSVPSAAIVFDMTVYGGTASPQPLIHAATLSYSLAS
jgi:LysM repeat protein